MKRGWLIGITAAVIIAGAFYALRESLRMKPAEGPAPVAPIPDEPVPVAKQPLPREAPAALGIRGHVVGPLLAPVAGADVVVGDEEARTGPDGSFSLPPAVRARQAKAVVRTSDRQVEWAGLIAGPKEPEPAAAEGSNGGDAPEPEPWRLPERPERLRWTFNLPEARPPGDAWILLDEAVAEDWGNSVRVRVRGRSRLPDGARISASLYFDGLRFIADLEPAVVEGGAFTSSLFAPEEVTFYSGTYEVHASYASVLQLPSKIDDWLRELPDVDWRSLSPPEGRRSIFVGDPAEARAEDLAAQTYYEEMLDSAQGLWRALKVRMNIIRRLRKGQEVAAGAESDLLGADGKLDLARWRKFLDEDWRPRLESLGQVHSGRGQEKYQEAGRILGGLLTALLQASYAFSRFVVYPFLNLPPDERDFYPDEDSAGDLTRLETIILGSFEELDRFRRLVPP